MLEMMIMIVMMMMTVMIRIIVVTVVKIVIFLMRWIFSDVDDFVDYPKVWLCFHLKKIWAALTRCKNDALKKKKKKKKKEEKKKERKNRFKSTIKCFKEVKIDKWLNLTYSFPP